MFGDYDPQVNDIVRFDLIHDNSRHALFVQLCENFQNPNDCHVQGGGF